ncbi:uncharacterized LOC107369487 [Tetranychus urticae]|uniref:UDP-glycosyltransferase 205B1 n=1 Tax=Tetranychus urticae TaxID=32264 RepID=T1L1Y0_TETUR|nr:uncharacterized LOC107369487 [Tetranychus urticae]AHX56913.1 UDP-glycosyltransferase 205B1 [Tetranychus urticae]
MVQKLKILCSAMDSLGHVNAILGFAKILEQRGHQVIIALAPGWKSAIEKHNFEFIPLKLDSSVKEEKEVKGEKKVGDESNGKDEEANSVEKVEDKSNSNDSKIVDAKSVNESTVTKDEKNSELPVTESDTKDEEKSPVKKEEDKSNLNDSGIADSESVNESLATESENESSASESVNEPSATETETKDTKNVEQPNQKLIGMINSQLKGFRLKPVDNARNSALKVPMWLDWYEKQFAFDDALQEVMDAVKPDMIVIDFMLRLPCLEKSSIPWAQLWSCNPIMLYNGHCPPATTGYPTDSPRELWDEYKAFKDQGDIPIAEYINKWLISRGVRPYTKDEIYHIGESKYLNFYTYPSILDYNDIAPRPAKWVRMDATVREPDDATPFVIPEKLAGKPGALIYFSLGTMGCVDLELMRRVISVCAKSPHRFIVSKGPLHEQIELPDNMWGESYVNQIAILPHVDLVITHAGNNTLTESLYFGKPVILMPLFFDQLDNAQRAHEKGVGIRIDTYNFQDSDLLDAIEKLLNDEPLKEKLAAISASLKASTSKETVCKLIEKTVALGKSPFDDDQVANNQVESE